MIREATGDEGQEGGVSLGIQVQDLCDALKAVSQDLIAQCYLVIITVVVIIVATAAATTAAATTTAATAAAATAATVVVPGVISIFTERAIINIPLRTVTSVLRSIELKPLMCCEHSAVVHVTLSCLSSSRGWYCSECCG
jgi:hypothetical protein